VLFTATPCLNMGCLTLGFWREALQVGRSDSVDSVERLRTSEMNDGCVFY
jgi:hypothetical protein